MAKCNFPNERALYPSPAGYRSRVVDFHRIFPPLFLPPGHEAAPACDDGLPGYARGENRDHLLRGGLCQRELHEPVLHPEGDCAGKCCAVVARSLHLRPPPSWGGRVVGLFTLAAGLRRVNYWGRWLRSSKKVEQMVKFNFIYVWTSANSGNEFKIVRFFTIFIFFYSWFFSAGHIFWNILKGGFF